MSSTVILIVPLLLLRDVINCNSNRISSIVESVINCNSNRTSSNKESHCNNVTLTYPVAIVESFNEYFVNIRHKLPKFLPFRIGPVIT